MATSSLHYSSIHHSLIKRHFHTSDTPPISSLILKPPILNTTLSFNNNSLVTFSISQTTSTTPSSSSSSTNSQTISYELLSHHLSLKDFQQADEETRRLLIVLAGEAAQKRGYVFFSEVKFISETELRTIDELWREHSNNRFGYSVQKRILDKANGDFTKFFIKIGWMKKLDTEVEQYNYRSFPSEFTWELSDDTPEGHLPLTNALRGTQLLNNILNHPAFDVVDKQQGGEGEGDIDNKDNEALTATGLKDNNSSSSKPLAQRIFKPDYSF